MNLIEARHLYKNFGATQAVVDLNLNVGDGEIYGLVGPDGAGKTTAIRLLCGALKPSPPPAGQEALARIHGYDVASQVENARAQIGYLPQRFSLYEELTVMENLRFFAEVRGLPAEEWQPRCLEILAFVGLDAFVNRRAGHLSGGMKQKLGLAAALVHRPRVLLLDEPTTGVDPATRQDFWQLLIRLVAGDAGQGRNLADDQRQRVAALVSTPYMDEAARCGRVGFMQSGRVTVEGTPGELRARLAGQVLALRAQPLAAARRIAQQDAAVIDAQMFGDRVHLLVAPGSLSELENRLPAALAAAGVEAVDLRTTAPQLEDVFISLSGRAPGSQAEAAV